MPRRRSFDGSGSWPTVFLQRDSQAVTVVLLWKTSDGCKNPTDKQIAGIYMPTLRGDWASTPDLFMRYGFNAMDVDAFLEKHNICLSLKIHPVNRPPHKIIADVENMNLLDIDDVYDVLREFDFLITDYSSVYFDYLLTDKPIIFAPFDMEDYVENDREFYYDYDDMTPGPKARNWGQVLSLIEEAIVSPEKYKSERQRVRSLFHKYLDDKSSERVFEEIRKEMAKNSKLCDAPS